MNGPPAEVCKAQKWMGKGNEWFEKLNILGWEKPSAWRVEVRGK
jgi:hypothetical protein